MTYVVDRQSTRVISLESSAKQEIDGICDKKQTKSDRGGKNEDKKVTPQNEKTTRAPALNGLCFRIDYFHTH